MIHLTRKEIVISLVIPILLVIIGAAVKKVFDSPPKARLILENVNIRSQGRWPEEFGVWTIAPAEDPSDARWLPPNVFHRVFSDELMAINGLGEILYDVSWEPSRRLWQALRNTRPDIGMTRWEAIAQEFSEVPLVKDLDPKSHDEHQRFEEFIIQLSKEAGLPRMQFLLRNHGTGAASILGVEAVPLYAPLEKQIGGQQ
jgi:hypothetical protein